MRKAGATRGDLARSTMRRACGDDGQSFEPQRWPASIIRELVV